MRDRVIFFDSTAVKVNVIFIAIFLRDARVGILSRSIL